MMLHRYDRSLAIVIALSINVIFFWLLQRGLGHPPQIRSTDQPAIEIVWVARTPKAVEVEATVTGKLETAIKIRSPSYKPHHINTDATIATSELESISTPLSFEIIEAPHSFQRDPLEHRKLLMEHHQDRLSLNFQDRSIGGVMQRMTKSSICRELRNALTSAQGNAHIIINTMKEHGCRI
jgi:hypothetical protein